jgi:hypothetical protein
MSYWKMSYLKWVTKKWVTKRWVSKTFLQTSFKKLYKFGFKPWHFNVFRLRFQSAYALQEHSVFSILFFGTKPFCKKGTFIHMYTKHAYIPISQEATDGLKFFQEPALWSYFKKAFYFFCFYRSDFTLTKNLFWIFIHLCINWGINKN